MIKMSWLPVVYSPYANLGIADTHHPNLWVFKYNGPAYQLSSPTLYLTPHILSMLDPPWHNKHKKDVKLSSCLIIDM